MKKLLILLLFGNCVLAQTVSTVLDDPTINLTDAVVFDTNGDLFISDYLGDTVYKVTTDGVVSVFVSGQNTPNGLAFDFDGNLFVVNSASAGEIKKYDTGGSLLETFLVGSFPSGIIKDISSNDMIFTRGSNNSLHRLAPDGTVTDIFVGAPLNFPIGLAYDGNDDLYVANFVGREIYRVGATLDFVATVPNGGGSGDPFLGFITYGNGSLWGTGYLSHKIYRINPNAIDDVSLFAGSTSGNDDGPLTDATFTNPNGIVFNEAESTLYITQFNTDGNLRKIVDVPLSINEFSSDFKITLSPNPTVDILELNLLSNETFGETRIDIYDISGRLIISLNDTSNENNSSKIINVSKLGAGMYILRLQATNGFTVSKSFIKK